MGSGALRSALGHLEILGHAAVGFLLEFTTQIRSAGMDLEDSSLVAVKQTRK